AERRAERRAAQHRTPGILEVLLRRPEVRHLAREDLAVLLHLQVGDDLRRAEHAHRDDDEADAVGKLRYPKGEAQHARVDVGSYEAEEQAPEHHRSEEHT